jgi:hypothetical protein
MATINVPGRDYVTPELVARTMQGKSVDTYRGFRIFPVADGSGYIAVASWDPQVALASGSMPGIRRKIYRWWNVKERKRA